MPGKISPPAGTPSNIGGPKAKGRKWQPLDLNTIPNPSTKYVNRTKSSDWSTDTKKSDAPAGPFNKIRQNQGSNAGRGMARQPAGDRQVGEIPIAMNHLSMTAGGTAGARVAKPQGEPLKSFTLFTKLPFELRIKIWRRSFPTGRVLQVIFDGADSDDKVSHYRYRLAPPLLAEANRFWTLVNFSTNPKFKSADSEFEKIMTYFNHKEDIILFAENTCMNTIVRFIKDQHDHEVNIQRLAILTSGQVTNCHTWNVDDPVHGPDQETCAMGEAIAGGCSVMQALHGRHEEVAWNELAPGVKGLKEVFFVVPTHLLPRSMAGKIDESMGFIPARGDGMTPGQVRVKKSIEKEVELVNAGSVLPNCSLEDEMNNWEGGNKPDFQFVSLVPKAAEGKKFDTMMISVKDLPKLNGNCWAFMERVERSTKCHLKIPEQEFGGQEMREIGFYGTEAAIEKAYEMIIERLVYLSGDKWNPPKYPKFKQGYRTAEDLGIDFFHPQAAASKY
ncbi:hypothetical protein MBM_01694 [Drepanopeziza brunnea f. sp. 'multigermtubi' MB_m1]|uniref:2EXR domain-containing protein n=1 Tax=Marssonina brunnea f. sp. multigermtubi (strain MB_m1) TaxID=1072389 RepID=K1X403_MARBU|nr:uncharacterized protein MBM_01694 [Drepanopeziza brunnea f. sp. 'multigermtubi' MB_m1]EKD19742.1 hypothetical protein MBM_01694 [Drepanopeziza brunnea f. sp. 'multigermtubi' MB_m1]